ncbi:hypothetical protein BH23BAC4_BH23BAC4_14880 [soil metagenome]
MTFRLIGSVMVLALIWTGCGPAGITPRTDAALEQAAEQLRDELRAPGLLIASAALYTAETGRFPDTPFALLGSSVAQETGLINLEFAKLDISPGPEGLQVIYELQKTRLDQTERSGAFEMRRTDDGFTANFELYRQTDPDHNGRRVPITTADLVTVERAGGQIRVQPDELRGFLAQGRELVPPFDEAAGMSVQFNLFPQGPELGTYVVTGTE